MDWAAHDHVPPTRQEPAAPQLLTTCWALKSPRTGRALTCGIYRNAILLEVRASYTDTDLIRSERVLSIEDGRRVAAEWCIAALAVGFVE